MKSTSKTRSGPPEIGEPESTVKATVVRTLALVLLTLVFASSVRFVPVIGRGMQMVVGTSAWQSLYPIFGMESGMQREQLILIGIMVASFVAALIVQLASVAGFRAYRRRR